MSIHAKMKIVSVHWYNEMGNTSPIGIVVAEYNDTKERKAFIGTGEGHDPNVDARRILEGGAKIYLPEAQRLCAELAVCPSMPL